MRKMHLTDEELIAAHLSGDITAFPALLERYLSPIYNFVLRLADDGEDAQDISQEAFLKAWKNIGSYRRESALFRTWLFRIARNTAIDHLRKKRSVAFSRFEQDDGSNALEEKLQDDGPSPEEVFARSHSAELLERAMAELPPRSREVLVLHYREEMTFDEIGTVLGEPLNTVKSRHRRALLALKRILETNQK